MTARGSSPTPEATPVVAGREALEAAIDEHGSACYTQGVAAAQSANAKKRAQTTRFADEALIQVDEALTAYEAVLRREAAAQALEEAAAHFRQNNAAHFRWGPNRNDRIGDWLEAQAALLRQPQKACQAPLI